MSAIALERPRARTATVRHGLGRVAHFVLVGAGLWRLWEGYRCLWMPEHWTWPFLVTDTTMPHIHSIFQALTGTPEVVLLRGQIRVEGDELVAEPGVGQFVARARFGQELKPAATAAA